MNKKTVFVCEYCGHEFENEAYCKKHEEIHIEDFSKKSSKEISYRLYHLSSFAGLYPISRTVLGGQKEAGRITHDKRKTV
jgi:hypothetical protein